MSVHFFTCTKQKKLLNLEVEIILGICCFPKVDSVFTFDFFFNIIWFILISFGHQTPQKAVSDITVSNSCSKEFGGNFV